MRRRDFIAGIVGSAVGWPRVAHAQQVGKIPLIGVLWHAGSAEQEGPYYKGLLEGFSALGYVEGRNIKFEHRFPNEVPERFQLMARELVALNVDVLVTSGNNAGPYAKAATAQIPIVSMLVADPIGSKLVDSLARPGGNLTALSTSSSDLVGRRLQMLNEIIPGLSGVAQLVNPNAVVAQQNIAENQAAAAQLQLRIQTFEARSIEQLEPAFDAMANAGFKAVTVGPGEGVPFTARALVAKLALARGLALCAYSRETFEPGALMSYGTDFVAITRRTAVYVNKILKGAKPSDLPVEGPTKFEFLVSLKTAKALGLSIPEALLARADEVVE
jgi:putative ABC transport system substrate-binding protein